MTFLVTSPKILAQGVDIFSPAYSIFFSVNFEWEPILQSKARNRRLGSDKFHKTIFYYTIVLAGSVEDEVAKALKEKKSMKDTVFGAARNVITRIKAFRKKRN